MVDLSELGDDSPRKEFVEQLADWPYMEGSIADMLIKQGKAEGKAEGEAEGEAKGEAKGIKKSVQKMILAKIPLAQIAEVMDMKLEQVEEISRELEL